MAQVIIQINSEDEARQWMTAIEQLNEETKTELTNVSTTLQDMQGVSSGSMVEDLANAGRTLCSGVAEVYESMGGVVNAVANVLHEATGLVESATGLLKTIGGIFGF